ncbi:uncharacterized protein LOC112128603 isoform X3 [Pongo abelii]|uniref:uncharacterized protein LOC112128603 isoform X3 n=1 Tax=Pongo abelii TaxID=9601 RepID=UPI0023E7E7F5|nr:uncharacterized protein LOC112128603 isoform X3 [Pongo abelii]
MNRAQARITDAERWPFGPERTLSRAHTPTSLPPPPHTHSRAIQPPPAQPQPVHWAHARDPGTLPRAREHPAWHTCWSSCTKWRGWSEEGGVGGGARRRLLAVSTSSVLNFPLLTRSGIPLERPSGAGDGAGSGVGGLARGCLADPGSQKGSQGDPLRLLGGKCFLEKGEKGN